MRIIFVRMRKKRRYVLTTSCQKQFLGISPCKRNGKSDFFSKFSKITGIDIVAPTGKKFEEINSCDRKWFTLPTTRI